MLGMNRNSAANYLHLLQMQGRVTLNHVGPAKIYSLSDKLPVDAVLKLSGNGVRLRTGFPWTWYSMIVPFPV